VTTLGKMTKVFSRAVLAAIILLALSAPAAAQDRAPRHAMADWCVTPPSLPLPCSGYPAAQQKTTLTDVIAVASPWDTVHIYPGTYTDRPNVSIQGLQITGVFGPLVTIFDGVASPEAALTVSAGDVVLDGFTFTHSEGGVGGGVDAAPLGALSDPAQGRCENLDRESPDEICYPAYVPNYLGGPLLNPGQCVPIAYPGDFTDAAGVNPLCPHALDGAFTLRNSVASDNWSPTTCDGPAPTCYGVKVIASGPVTIDNVEASNNGSGEDCTGHGYELTKGRGDDGESCFGILAFSVGQDGGLVMTDIEANDNRAAGNCYRHETCFGVMADETLWDVTLTRITTNNNGADGNCSGDDVCFGTAADGVEGKTTMIDVVAKDNGAQGSCVNGSGTGSPPQYGPISLNDSCSGIVVDGEDWSLGLSIDRADASHNGAFAGECSGGDSCMGLIIDGRGGDIKLRDVTTNDNGATGDCNGSDMCAGIVEDPSDVVGVFSLTNVQANGNGAGVDCKGGDSCFGILHDTGFCSGNVEMNNVEASNNGSGRDCPGGDSCQGIVIDSGDNTGSFIFTSVTANDNGAGGVCGGEDNCTGILIDDGGINAEAYICDDYNDPDTCDFEDIVAYCPLFGDGPWYPPIGEFFVSLTDLEANSNGAGGNCTREDTCSGVLVDGALGGVMMTNIEANANGAGGNCTSQDTCSGAIVDGALGDVDMKNVTAKDNDRDGINSSSEDGDLSIRASVAYENGEDGVSLEDLVAGNTFQVNGSILCANGEAALRMETDDDVTVDATGNWYGCPDGPDGLEPPCDRVDVVNSGSVDYTPWIDTTTASAPASAIVGQPAIVSFQFSGGPPAVYLGEGPGDLYGDPTFIVTTDNGTVTGDFINAPNGVMEVTLVPDHDGTATV